MKCNAYYFGLSTFPEKMSPRPPCVRARNIEERDLEVNAPYTTVIISHEPLSANARR